MSMKKFVFVSLVMACLPFLAMAQTNDDLYFIPKRPIRLLLRSMLRRVLR